MSNQETINQVLEHIEKIMIHEDVCTPVTLYTGEEVIEKSTGASRGEGSISIIEATEYDDFGVILFINDEMRGIRGTGRLDDFKKVLQEELKIADKHERTLRLVIGQSRDRRATWQEVNDDTRGQKDVYQVQ